jgi:hypothetical protein
VSRRGLVHVLEALWRRSGAAGFGVPAADIDAAIGRSDGDMRTPLDLQSLRDDDLVRELIDGTWALTPQGIARLAQDRDLSERR